VTVDLAELVRGHSFARDLADAQLAALCEGAEAVRPEPGERLFSEGRRADRCYLIIDGHVDIEVHVPHRGAAVVASVGPDEVLGWSWLLPPHRWRFDAVARTRVLAAALDAAAVRAACDVDPDLARIVERRLITTMTARLEAARHQLLDLYGHEPG
jgi:CRP-like cAMP-binding protein